MKPSGIDTRYLDALRGVFRSFPAVKKVWLYGSRARGDYRPESDIDLAIEAPGMPFGDFLLLRSRLDDLPVVFRIDSLLLDTLEDDALRQSIHRDAVALYETPA